MEEYKYKNWTFTWNCDDEVNLPEVSVLESYLRQDFCAYAFQFEKGTVTSRLHIQGCFKTKNRTRKSTLLNQFQKSFGDRNIKNLTIERAYGTFEECFSYATKDETRMGTQVYMSESLKVYQGNDIKLFYNNDNLYPWQKKILEEILDMDTFDFKTPDDRSIYWICDSTGNCGKSKLVKFLCYNFPNAVKVPFGSAAQMRSACIHAGPKTLYIVDIPRTLGEDDNIHNVISVLEDIKNGHITSSFYGKLGSLMFDPPHVLVFSNLECPLDTMSGDRWRSGRIIHHTKQLFGI